MAGLPYEDAEHYTYSNTMYNTLLFGLLVFFGAIGYITYALGGMEEAMIVTVIYVCVYAFIAAISFPTLKDTHRLYEDKLVVSQGILFEGVVYLSEIESYGVSDQKPIGLGVKFGGKGRLFVCTSWKNNVYVKLRSPKRFGRAGFKMEVKELYFNLDDPERFLFDLKTRMSKLRL